MLIVPVLGGTVKVSLVPTFCCPGAAAVGSDPVCTVLTHVPAAGGFGGPAVPPFTGAGAEPVGLQEGDAVADRQRPPTHVSCEFTPAQSVVHCAKQNDPVDVLTHVLPEGQVLWSDGLHAAVHAPPGNSGPVPHISPAPVHCPAPVPVHAFPRLALTARSWAGQIAAGAQAPSPGQQV